MNEISQKIFSHNQNNNLKFVEQTHKYFINSEEYISVTTKIQKYFPFKRDEVSKIIAEKNWTTEKEVTDEWDALTKNGSAIHELIEQYLKNENLGDKLQYINHAITFLQDHKEFEIIASEIRVFSKKYKVAGSIDLIVKDKSTNKLYTIDWKTSRKDINKSDFWEMGKKPFNKIPKNKFYQYSLQLSTYNKILKEEYGVEIWDSYIVHLKNDFKTYLKIEPMNMDYESEILLELEDSK